MQRRSALIGASLATVVGAGDKTLSTHASQLASQAASSPVPSSFHAPPSKLLKKLKLGLAFASLRVVQAEVVLKPNGLDVLIVTLSGDTTSAETLDSGGIQFAASDVIHGDQKGLNLLAVANLLNANDVELTIAKKVQQADHIAIKNVFPHCRESCSA